MNDETIMLVKARYDYNKTIIKNKLVGYGNSMLENDLIDLIMLSEGNTGFWSSKQQKNGDVKHE